MSDSGLEDVDDELLPDDTLTLRGVARSIREDIVVVGAYALLFMWPALWASYAAFGLHAMLAVWAFTFFDIVFAGPVFRRVEVAADAAVAKAAEVIR